MLATMSRIMGTVLWARVNGSWKRSPLFNAGDQKPIVPVRVLAPDELQRARSAV